MPSEFSSTLERNQARGLKACINNPRVSETAKQNAQQRLDELTMQSQESLSDDNQDTRRVRIQGSSLQDNRSRQMEYDVR
ncbi:hypothetical protein BJ165DRAFT_1526494 [Panaeolus papilionaceus]|nr:hypothetical protein BJ165DRAFT_1526494 [Panaeolus papilionaceus]